MDNKYLIDSKENKEFMLTNALRLLEFGRRFPAPGGSSYYLGGDGTPCPDKPRETWITSRMAHVYSIGSMLSAPGTDASYYKALAGRAINGLRGELKDTENGGWFSGIDPDGSVLPNKMCYAHAFVILAASSALCAGVEGAKELLDDALATFDRYFWDEDEGMTRDSWDTSFKKLDPYRGLNANMHTVEAFLAVADATGNDLYRERAGRIIDRVIAWAGENSYRIPEHYDENWEPQNDLNKDNPADPFKPYGVTPGHGIEWARLIAQWAVSTYRKNKLLAGHYIDIASKLYGRAVDDAWCADGAEGLVYTTDLDGKPIIHDRMHWTLAEAINTSAVLYRITGEDRYARDLAVLLEYLDKHVMDHKNGSWFHQLDAQGNVLTTVWPGKPDVYHAFQAMLIPYLGTGLSIASAIKTEYLPRQ